MRFRWIVMRHISTHTVNSMLNKIKIKNTKTNRRTGSQTRCSRMKLDSLSLSRILIKVNQCCDCGWNLIQFDLFFMIVFSLVWLYCSITIPQHVRSFLIIWCNRIMNRYVWFEKLFFLLLWTFNQSSWTILVNSMQADKHTSWKADK